MRCEPLPREGWKRRCVYIHSGGFVAYPGHAGQMQSPRAPTYRRTLLPRPAALSEELLDCPWNHRHGWEESVRTGRYVRRHERTLTLHLVEALLQWRALVRSRWRRVFASPMPARSARGPHPRAVAPRGIGPAYGGHASSVARAWETGQTTRPRPARISPPRCGRSGRTCPWGCARACRYPGPSRRTSAGPGTLRLSGGVPSGGAPRARGARRT